MSLPKYIPAHIIEEESVNNDIKDIVQQKIMKDEYIKNRKLSTGQNQCKKDNVLANNLMFDPTILDEK